jgi:hypothetical protein
LSLPKGKNERESIRLGEGSPPARYRIPLSDKPSIGEGWIADLKRIQFSVIPVPFDISLTAVAAITLEPNFTIALPSMIVDAIYDYLGARSIEELEGGLIDCEVRNSLPDLTLTNGDIVKMVGIQ